MSDVLHLAWRSLRAAPGRSAVVALGMAVALFLPLLLVGGERVLGDAVRARALATPIVVGKKGNEVDLVLSTLYFRGRVREETTAAEVESLRARGLDVVPMVLGATASGAPVVGTTLGYLDRRGLVAAEGRTFAVLGEAVVGAAAAAELGLRPGDRVGTDQADLYNLAGSYPTRLEVVGVLAPTGSPDDDALFVDARTAWMVRGSLHGHAAVTGESDASLLLYQEVTDETRASFHLHGGPADWPVTGALVFPASQKDHDLVLGAYAVDDDHQAARPVDVVNMVLDIVMRARKVALELLSLVIVATVGFVGLIAALVVRLRQAEITLMVRLGASRARVAGMLAAELGILGLIAAGLAVAATVVVLGSVG